MEKLEQSGMTTDPPLIYNYLDYRKYLGDLIAFKKNQNKNFSYRFWARNCGFSSPNFIKLVVEGKRNLSAESIAKISDGFSMDSRQRDFFENMVLMNQASTHKTKDRYYQKMMSARQYSKNHRIDKESYEYFSRWYYPAVREIIGLKNTDQSPETIAAMLNPSITPKEAEKAVRLLESLSLIRKNEENVYIVSEKTLTTGPEVRSLVVANYHREMIRLAGESLERFSPDERNVTALTLSVSHEKVKEIIDCIAELRQNLLRIASGDDDADQVIQVNFQMFPLSRQG